MIATCIATLFLSLIGNPTDPKPATGEAPVVYQGLILDAANAESLAGATVRIEELGITTISDFDGRFEFDAIPPGTYTLSISLVSYADEAQSSVIIDQSHSRKQVLMDSL